MNRFMLFLKKFHPLLIFIVLEALAINYYARSSSSYNSARFISLSNSVAGVLYQWVSEVGSYFSLRSENAMLVEETARLNNELAAYLAAGEQFAPSVRPPYFYSTARVINNSINHQENLFTIDKGIRDGIEVKNAILTPDGVAVGYVLASSNKFSVCMSLLNTQFRTSGKIKDSGFFGSLFWDGRDSRIMTMSEVSRYADINVGDTVVTTDYSSIFPSDVTVGTIEDFSLSDNAAYYDVKIKLATPFSSLGDVLVVKYEDAQERLSLEESTEQTNSNRRRR